jgi:antitoxin PrlF
MPTATLSRKGQAIVPKAICDHLDLHPGDSLDFIVQDNGDVLIRPAVEDVRKLKGLLRCPGRKAVSIQEMNQSIGQQGRKRP